MYRAFLTDYMGTLKFDGFPAVVRGVEKRLRIPYGRLQTVITEKYWPQWSLGQISEEEFFKKTIEEVGAKFPDPNYYRPGDFTRDILWISGEPYPDMMDFFERLKNEGIRTGVITNISPEMFDALQQEKWYSRQGKRYQRLTGSFDTIVPSFEVGVRKPDERIYMIVLERLGVSPEETVYIDNEDADVEGAKRLGITVVKFPTLEGVPITGYADIYGQPNFYFEDAKAWNVMNMKARQAVSLLENLYKEGR